MVNAGERVKKDKPVKSARTSFSFRRLRMPSRQKDMWSSFGRIPREIVSILKPP